MENFDDVVYACIVSFLTTREYVLTLSISKTLQSKSLKHKKLRMPFITASTYDRDNRCKLKCQIYHFTKECKSEKNWPKHGCIHSNSVVISTILKFGGKCMKYGDNVYLDVVPWKYRNPTHIKDYEISIHDYVNLKLKKYEQKIEINPNLNGFYFDKLIRKRKELKKYTKTPDVYMDECEDYLENLIQNKK
jgi:hypothetical protein